MADTAAPKVTILGHLTDGRPVQEFTLRNAHGMSAAVLEYGAILRRLHVPGADARTDNVVLGYQSLDEYLTDPFYLGATIGRFANRIADGTFELDGQRYQLDVNDPPNSVHGGRDGFNTRLWAGTRFATEHSTGVRLHYRSPDREGGYPGTLDVETVYELPNDDNTLRISYSATTDRPTILNLTNHIFFNLGGEGSGPILDHEVQLVADHFLPLTPEFLPTGELRSVSGTPLDFREPHRIGERINADDEQLRLTRGYDHNFALRREGPELSRAATVRSPAHGRTLEVWTTQPAIDFYTGNYFDGTVSGTGGRAYEEYAGLAIEPEHFSNSPNIPGFASTALRPADRYDSATELRFSTP